jgi:lipopolysaccharide/colanic/teichoic acid biosynthesis glycosyltransferase
MNVIPVILDVRPAYCGPDGSALLLPGVGGSVLADVVAQVAAVTAHPPSVLPLFAADAAYERAIRAACPAVVDILSPAKVRDPLAFVDAADSLLLVGVECYPADGIDLRPLMREAAYDARMARHLLAFETTALRTKEFVQQGDDGRVRRIQRYFEPVTWPFPAGVVASIVPAACLLSGSPLLPASLDALRAALSARGLPNQDVPFHGHVYRLSDEDGALEMAERLTVARVHADAEAGVRVTTADSARVHPSARLVGPVVVSAKAVVHAGALVIGPMMIGAGAVVGVDAVVAQCLVLPGAAVAAGTTHRHAVLPAARAGEPTPTGPRRRYVRSAPAPSTRPAVRPGWFAVKAWLEPPVALLALVLLSPLFVIVGLLVALTSPGPIFYGALREGLHGRPFRCLKFRSMRINADAMQRALAAAQQMDGPQFKMDDDPRVTWIGWWLRRLNIDELPQLINVLKGEMSFVGPRPSPFRENQICIPWRQARLSVRPGITGLWQICRRDRSTGDFHQWIHYDGLYVRHAGPGVDLRIIWATIRSMGGNQPTDVDDIIHPDATRGAVEADAPLDLTDFASGEIVGTIGADVGVGAGLDAGDVERVTVARDPRWLQAGAR